MRIAWGKIFFILVLPLVGVGALVTIGALDRVDAAREASDALDGIYPFASVAGMEGAIHEEGSLAIAVAAGLVDADEFGVAVAATDAAHDEVREELTYHDEGSPIALALGAIDAEMDTIGAARGQLLAGTYEGAASEPYRAMLALTRAGTQVTSPLLVAIDAGAPALATLDIARSASGDAVFEATAAIFEGRDGTAVTAALERLAAADRLLAEIAPPDLAAELEAALSTPEATLAADGAALVAAGELPDLLAWADATPAWVLAYGIPEAGEIEATSAELDAAASNAESGAIRFIVVSIALTLAGLMAAMVLARRTLIDRAAPNPLEAARAAAVVRDPVGV